MKKQIANLREKAGRHKTLIQNFSYLSALQMFNMLIPLITYPYLIRVLGKETYGLVIFAQAIIAYLVILVGFGFNISATKDVSIHRDNKEKLSEIVSNVLFIKLGLFLIAIAIISFLAFFIPQVQEYKALFFLTMWMCLYDVIFPIWYFQGIEQMKYITYITLVSRLIFLGLIFVFIHSPDDYLLVPIINGIGATIAGIIALSFVFGSHKIKIKIPTIEQAKHYFIDSFILFLSNAVMVFKDKTNVILIGSFLGTGAVAEFDLAMKIKDILFIPVTLLNQTIYPKVSREKNLKFMMKILKISVVVMTIISALVFFLMEPIIVLLGGRELSGSIHIAKIILVALPFTVLSFTLATNCINALGYYKLRFKIMIIITIIYSISIFIGYYLKWIYHLEFYAYAMVFVYFIELLIRLFFIRKYNMLK